MNSEIGLIGLAVMGENLALNMERNGPPFPSSTAPSRTPTNEPTLLPASFFHFDWVGDKREREVN